MQACIYTYYFLGGTLHQTYSKVHKCLVVHGSRTNAVQGTMNIQRCPEQERALHCFRYENKVLLSRIEFGTPFVNLL